MVRRYCCVPGCKTGYPSQRKVARAEGKPKPSIFVPPRDSRLFEDWKRVLRKVDKKLTRVDSICELHFAKEDVEKYYVHKLPNGTTNMLKKGRPTLRAGAVPFINPSPTQHIQKKDLTKKAESENKTIKRNDYEKDERENIQEDGTEGFAKHMNISLMYDNIVNELTHTTADDAGKNVQEDEANNRTKDSKVDQSKTAIPIIITDVRSMHNTGGLGRNSEGFNLPALEIAKSQEINMTRIRKGRSIFEKETSPSFSWKGTLLERLDAGAKLLGKMFKEETTTARGRMTKRKYPGKNKDIRISRAKQQRQDTRSINEGFSPILHSSILERLDAMNQNIETNTSTLSTLSKTISDSSKENVRALNNLTAAITKVGSLFASMHETGQDET